MRILLENNPDAKMILLSIAGFGDKCSKPGEGHPVAIDYFGGRARLMVWSDINQEDPTHIIDLDSARETNRDPN